MSSADEGISLIDGAAVMPWKDPEHTPLTARFTQDTEMLEVDVLDLGTGSLRVDPNVEHTHHHLVCSSCGRVRDLPVEFDGLRVPGRFRQDFTIDAVQVIFRGRCDDCQRRLHRCPRYDYYPRPDLSAFRRRSVPASSSVKSSLSTTP